MNQVMGPLERLTADGFNGSALTSRGKTAHIYARETLRQAILNGQLPGGTRLVQTTVAELLDVSTTPVREAMRDLASDGLIKFDAHRGGIVTELNHDDMEEVYLIRQRLEPLAIELAIPHMTDRIVAEASELHTRMTNSSNSTEWTELNRDFHMAVYEPCGRPRLIASVRSLQETSMMMVSTSLQSDPRVLRDANDDHAKLIVAIDARDIGEATAIVENHLRISLRVIAERRMH